VGATCARAAAGRVRARCVQHVHVQYARCVQCVRQLSSRGVPAASAVLGEHASLCASAGRVSRRTRGAAERVATPSPAAHGLGIHHVVEQLKKVRWFRNLSQHELETLAKRGTPIFFPRYSTIIREGNLGSFFYLLLEGQACRVWQVWQVWLVRQVWRVWRVWQAWRVWRVWRVCKRYGVYGEYGEYGGCGEYGGNGKYSRCGGDLAIGPRFTPSLHTFVSHLRFTPSLHVFASHLSFMSNPSLKEHSYMAHLPDQICPTRHAHWTAIPSARCQLGIV
jgi:hypothetical protein